MCYKKTAFVEDRNKPDAKRSRRKRLRSSMTMREMKSGPAALKEADDDGRTEDNEDVVKT
jgi:hypothetical protein